MHRRSYFVVQSRRGITHIVVPPYGTTCRTYCGKRILPPAAWPLVAPSQPILCTICQDRQALFDSVRRRQTS